MPISIPRRVVNTPLSAKSLSTVFADVKTGARVERTIPVAPEKDKYQAGNSKSLLR